MKLSTILPTMGYTDFILERERGFELLSLASDFLEQPSCVFVEDAKFISEIAENVTMVIASKSIDASLFSERYGLCLVDNPRIVFFSLHNYLSKVDGYKRALAPSTVGERCSISPLSSIAKHNVHIGNDVVIEEFVVIRENTTIGDGTIIRSGTVVGGQGFEFKRDGDKMLPVAHAGGVTIGQNVELQHNNCVDRGVYPWDDTILDDYVKTDNLVHIAHGAKIGNAVCMAACAMIAGRVVIGKNTWVGPSASITNSIEIGQNARVNIGSVATKSILDNEAVTGNFAIPHKLFMQNLKKSIIT